MKGDNVSCPYILTVARNLAQDGYRTDAEISERLEEYGVYYNDETHVQPRLYVRGDFGVGVLVIYAQRLVDAFCQFVQQFIDAEKRFDGKIEKLMAKLGLIGAVTGNHRAYYAIWSENRVQRLALRLVSVYLLGGHEARVVILRELVVERSHAAALESSTAWRKASSAADKCRRASSTNTTRSWKSSISSGRRSKQRVKVYAHIVAVRIRKVVYYEFIFDGHITV